MCWGTAKARQWRIESIAKRDGFHCWLCGGGFHRNNGKGRVTLDHAIPKAKGGTNHLFNLRLAHEFCNHERGAITEAPNRAARLRLSEIRITVRNNMGTTHEADRCSRELADAG